MGNRPSRPGGGWQALLADIRGDGDPVTAARLRALADPSDGFGRWCRPTLDEAWAAAHRLTTTPGDAERLGEVS